MIDTKRMKVLFANLCCFIIITVFIYHGEKYNLVNSKENVENIDAEIFENIKEISEPEMDIEMDDSEETLSSNPLLSQKYQRKLCELDKPSIQELKDFNTTVKKTFNSKKVIDYINNFFHKFIQNPHRAFCKDMKRFGGDYNPVCKFTDGSKFVCMDELLKDILNGECLIYSFGVAEDWTFEDIMDDLGCKVYAIDGSIDHPPTRGKNIHFEKAWVYFENMNDETGIPYVTFPSLLAKHGNTKTKVSYLKMDVEGNERKCLPHWLFEGALDNVKQIGMEFHLDNDIVRTNKFIKTMRYLYFKGNYRLISYEANGCAKNTETNNGRNRYFNLAEIVLKKITDDDDCI